MQCEFCDRKFKYKKSFSQHMQNEHGISDESDVPLSNLIEKNESIADEETTTHQKENDANGINLLICTNNIFHCNYVTFVAFIQHFRNLLINCCYVLCLIGLYL